MHDVDHVVLVTGGLGITYCMQFLDQAALHSNWKTCKLIWTIREESELLMRPVRPQGTILTSDVGFTAGLFELIEPHLHELVVALQQRHKGRTAPQILIDLHCTQAPLPGKVQGQVESLVPVLASGDTAKVEDASPPQPKRTESDLSSKSSVASLASLSPWIKLTRCNGRPQGLAASAGHLVPSTVETLAIVACGPAALCDDARVEALAWRSQQAWADITYFEECFIW